MKHDNALPVTGTYKRDSRPCYLSHVRSLLNAIRARHRRTDPARRVDEMANDDADHDVVAPTPHDFHVGELEASVHSASALAGIATGKAIRHDSPAELARARRVFAATWLIPLLVVSIVLVVFGNALDQSLFALLQFSAVALAVPLAGSSAALVYRALKRRHA